MYSAHQGLFYAWHFGIAAIITLKDMLSSSSIPHVLSIPHFPQPSQRRTTSSVYCLMGPSGMVMDFSTAQSFYFSSTLLPFLWLVLCLPAPFAGSHQTSALTGGHSLMPAHFCHFGQFVSLWGITFALSSVSSTPSVAWHKVYHMMHWPPALLLSLYALIILY